MEFARKATRGPKFGNATEFFFFFSVLAAKFLRPKSRTLDVAGRQPEAGDSSGALGAAAQGQGAERGEAENPGGGLGDGAELEAIHD
jgi:hypothetical protein